MSCVVAGDRRTRRAGAAADLVGLGERLVGGVAGRAPDAPGGAGACRRVVEPRLAAVRRALVARLSTSLRAWSRSCSRSRIRSSVLLRPRLTSFETSSLASPRVIRPRLTASSTTSWTRSRERLTLRSSASRNACTLLSERPAEAGAPARRRRPPGRGPLRRSATTRARPPRRPVWAWPWASPSPSPGPLPCTASGLRAAGPGRHENSSPRGTGPTISSGDPRGKLGWVSGGRQAKRRGDRRVVREPDRAIRGGDLAALAGATRREARPVRARRRAGGRASPARSARARPNSRARRSNTAVSAGRRLRSPPRTSGVSPAQSSAVGRGEQHLAFGELAQRRRRRWRAGWRRRRRAPNAKGRARVKAITRRSGRGPGSSTSSRRSRISPRTRVRFAPPSLEAIRSGLSPSQQAA